MTKTKEQIISRIVEIMPAIGGGVSQDQIKEKLQVADTKVLNAQLIDLERLNERGSAIRATNLVVNEEFDERLAKIRKERVDILNRMAQSLRQISPGKIMDTGGEQDDFTVVLVKVGNNEPVVLKKVGELTGLGMKEAGELISNAPIQVQTGISMGSAEKAKTSLQEAGATVETCKESEYSTVIQQTSS